MRGFKSVKKEIIYRAKVKKACEVGLTAARYARSSVELLRVITENYQWCHNRHVIDIPLLLRFPEEDRIAVGLYIDGAHEVVDKTVFVDGDASVVLSGRSLAYCFGRPTVMAIENAIVYANDETRVVARGESTVYAKDNTRVNAYNKVEVRSEGIAVVTLRDESSIAARGYTIIEAFDKARVIAHEHCTANLFNYAVADTYDQVCTHAHDYATIGAHGFSQCFMYQEAKGWASDNANLDIYSSYEPMLHDYAVARYFNGPHGKATRMAVAKGAIVKHPDNIVPLY